MSFILLLYVFSLYCCFVPINMNLLSVEAKSCKIRFVCVGDSHWLKVYDMGLLTEVTHIVVNADYSYV
jgi:hypothetical protein